jgi:hypothetical protein
LLASTSGFEVAGEAHDGPSTIALVRGKPARGTGQRAMRKSGAYVSACTRSQPFMDHLREGKRSSRKW